MGVEYSSRLCLGYEFTAESLEKYFAVQVPEKSHMEPRYHSKTGARIEDEKVIDSQAGTEWRIPGETETYDMRFDEFLDDVLAGYLNCSIDVATDQWCGETGKVVIGPAIPTEDEYDFDRHTLYAGCKFTDMMSKQDELEKIATRLRKLDINPGPAVVTIVTCVF